MTRTRSWWWQWLPILVFLLLLLVVGGTPAWTQQQQHQPQQHQQQQQQDKLLSQGFHGRGSVKGVGLIVLTNPTTIDLYWNRIDTATAYNIEWNEVDGENGGQNTVSNIVTSYTIMNLQPCTEYLVSVEAVQDGEQLEFEEKSAQTKVQAPSPVTGLQVTSVKGEATLEVIWNLITSSNCKVYYRVSWSSACCVNGTSTTNDAHYTITNLTYNTQYNVCVSSSAQGYDAAPTCDAATTAAENTLSITLLPAATSIEVSWYIIDGADLYVVTWADSSDGGSWQALNGTTDRYTITHLQPCTNYFVQVEARTGSNQLQTDSNSTLTLPQAPSPVTDLNVTPVDNEATLEVAWSPVTPPGNCDLTYRVTWSLNNNTQTGSITTSETAYTIRDLSYGTNYTVCVDPWVEGHNAAQVCQQATTIVSRLLVHLQPNVTSIDVEWTKDDDDDSYFILWFSDKDDEGWAPLDGGTDHYIITDLQTCTDYTVIVEARRASLIVTSDLENTRTLALAPSPVTNLSAAQVDSDAALKVMWSPVTPPGNCDLTYRVTWSLTNNINTESNTTSETVYTIRDLSYGRSYTVCVDPWVEGHSAAQVCQQADISSKLDLHLVAHATSIDVLWTIDDTADTYIILWSSDNDEDGWSSVGSGVNFFTITNRRHCTDYNVILEASKGTEILETDLASTRTSAADPSPVTILSVTSVDTEPALKVMWSPVTPPGNCDLTYRITWSFTNNTQTGSNITSETEYTIRDLSYGRSYTVCVDPWVEGHSAAQVCQQADISSNLDLHLEASSTTITASWINNNNTDSYVVLWSSDVVSWISDAVFWTRPVEGVDGGKLKWVGGNETSSPITDLQPSSNYTVFLVAWKDGKTVDRDEHSITTLPQALRK